MHVQPLSLEFGPRHVICVGDKGSQQMKFVSSQPSQNDLGAMEEAEENTNFLGVHDLSMFF